MWREVEMKGGRGGGTKRGEGDRKERKKRRTMI